MALAGVGAAVNYIGDLAVEEAKYLYGVEQQVEELQDELEWMTCFLEDVDAKRDRDARMRKWIKQISWLAYQSEDIIESFILKVELQRRGGIIKKLKRYSCIMREAKDLHELGSDIDALKLKISTLTSRLHTYGIKTTEQGSSSSVRREQLRKSYTHHMEDENDIIGLDGDVKVVLNRLMADDSRVVALWGVGGLGKTTLAKKVYHHQDVRQYFDASAWVSISQQCNANSVLKELLRGLTSEDEVNDTADRYLMEKLCRVQREKKCLVVLDDIWKKEAWDSLKAAFPNDRENSSGGKLMLTTRIESVAKYADDNAFIYKQVPLDDSKAWLLLQTKLGPDPLDVFGQDSGPKMKELVKKMLKHCGGLPLAIVVLGGILAAKKSLDEWKIAHDSIKSLLSNEKDSGLSCKEVLELSYYDFPFHLKPCFLYLGIFPEDTEISATKLIHLWMAEGFISTGSDDDDDYIDQQGSLEKLGEAYLAELVDRSMVQVGSTRRNGRISTCRIHDLMRELSLSKAAEENFLKVLAVGDSASSSSISLSTPSFTMNTRKRYRRFAVHGDDVSKKVITGVCIPNKKFNAPQHVKSLFFCGHYIHLESSILRKVAKKFRLLRVLDLVGIDVVILPKGVGELVHLRFLSIRGSWIQVVPSSIVKLKSLQTLDLRSSSTVEWSPNIIWRMSHLRHVYMPDRIRKPSMEERILYKCVSSKLHQREGGLNHNLEALINFMQLHRLKDVAGLTSLRKLSVNINEEIKMKGEPLIEVADALQDCLHLNKMKLLIRGRVLSPSSSGSCSLGSNMLPRNLTSLTLHDTKIGNPYAMQILEKLPSLRKLFLLSDSYIGKGMTCSHGGFPELVFLSVVGLGNLEEWIIESGAMPCLLSLVIRYCIKLKPFPDGIKSISNVKELKIVRMRKHFCDKAREWKEPAIEGDVEDGEGASSEIEDQGHANSSKFVIQHIPNIKIRAELDYLVVFFGLNICPVFIQKEKKKKKKRKTGTESLICFVCLELHVFPIYICPLLVSSVV